MVAPCQAAAWVKLGENPHARLFIDKQSIIEQKPHKKAWVKIEYKTPQKNLESVEEKTYTLAKALWFFDCVKQQSATTQVFQYHQQTLIYSAGAEVKDADFIEPVPESEMDMAMRYVCKDTAPPASTSHPAPTKSATTPAAQTPAEPLKATPAAASQPAQAPEQAPEKAEPVAAVPAEPASSKPATKKPNAVKGKSSANWSYGGKTGPAHWADLSADYATCAAGLNQSPINITSTIHAALKPIRTLQKFPAKELINTGQTLQLNFKSGNMMVLDKTPFQLSHVHFHSPSENRIDGKAFPLEAHFVHSDNQGNLAVIAVLFKEGEANPALNQLWAQLPEEIGKPVLLKTRITPNNLMPIKQQYYRYSGSLEMPPCTEGVRWILMKTPVEATKDQLKMYETAMQVPNNRPTQALNGRMVVE